MIRLQTLGALGVSAADGAVRVGRKELALFAYLARRSPKWIPRAELAALLWGERQEAQARQSLRQALVRLKRALPLPLEVHAERVALLPGDWELDVAALESDLEAGRLEVGVAHWQGEFLEGAEDIGAEGYRHWVEVEREALRQLVIRAFERLVDGAERSGDWRAATDWAERWTRVAPLDERAHRRLVEALRLAGRSDEAAARHAAFVARIRLDLGVEPSRDLLRLGSELAQQAPAGRRARPSPGSRALFTPDLVGRATALAGLSASWDAVRAGSSGAVLVDGEEGIGKTRLCEEFLRAVACAGDGALVLRARGYEAGRDVPWAVARELLAPLKDAAGVPGASPGALAALGRLVPAIRERFPLQASATPEWSAEEAVAETLTAAAGESPLIVFLDDLPSADAATQQLIVSLTRRKLGSRVLLMLTARSDDLERAPALAELRTGTGLQRMRLHPLQEAEVEALLGSMLDLSAQDRRRLAERLVSEGGGNPFHVVQITSALLDEGHLAPDAMGTWRLSPPAGPEHPLPLPASVREAVGRRINWLSDAARHLVNSAAVLGRPASRLVLGELAGLSPVDLDSALDELIARRLLRAAPLPEDSYEYAHELTRRIVYDLLPTPSRHRLHRAAWLALRRAEKDSGARAARAYHRTRAGSAAWPLLAWTRSRRAAAAAGAITVLAALAVIAVARRPAEGPAVVAVGAIRDHTGPDGGGLTRAVADLLATNLARLPGVQMVSTARLYEVQAQIGTMSDSSSAIARAARQAGATEVLEGALYRMPDSSLRLDLRRVDLRSGALRGAYSARGSDPFALVDAATEELARRLEIPGERGGPALRVTDVTTASLMAYRFYEEGLRAFHRDPRSAERLFEAALVEDSTFAMAAYYVAKSRMALGDEVAARPPLLRAARLSARAPERERLLIRTTLAAVANDPNHLVMAESLATRYPNEPDGHLLVGQALAHGGDFLGALAHFRRVLAMDSLSFRGGAVRCRACEALAGLVGAYQWADSLDAALRIQRTVTQRLGNSAMLEAAWILSRLGRTDEALATMRQFAPADYRTTALRATAGIRSGAFAEVDGMLHESLRAGAADLRGEALWYLSISLRHQGRLAEGLAVARRLRRLYEPSSVGVPLYAVVEAQTLFEMGRARAAAAIFDSVGRLITDTLFPLRTARHIAWELTHESTALAAVGDTVALVRLADTIETYGNRSAYGRDRRLHHYVRGLLWHARGRPADAEREFRAALHSLNLGYTRINLELGATLLRLKRPAEAARIIAPALRGELHASNLYVTHTELHELLARAYDAADQPDSALVHYRWVVNAWRNADPIFHERREAARRRLAVFEGRVNAGRDQARPAPGPLYGLYFTETVAGNARATSAVTRGDPPTSTTLSLGSRASFATPASVSREHAENATDSSVSIPERISGVRSVIKV